MQKFREMPILKFERLFLGYPIRQSYTAAYFTNLYFRGNVKFSQNNISEEYKHMKIAINIRLVRPNGMDGIGWFSYEIVRRWVACFPEHDFILLTDKSSLKEQISGHNVQHKVLLPPARRLFLINWWNSKAKHYVNKIQPDIFISLDGQYAHPINVPVLTVIHDLNFHHHPEWMTEKLAHFYNSSFPECAANADRIATVSAYSKKDISESYGIAADKIDVVYNGFNEKLLAVQNNPQKENPYFFFIGIQVPRKNITGLIKSFTLFKETYKTDHQLKLAGHDYMWDEEMKNALLTSSVRNDIILLGRKDFIDIEELYAGAEALLYIPYFEGFGIPVLEGYAAGLPVICSNTTSLPEVAGEAALMFSPTDYKGIAQAMHRVTTDENLRKDMVLQGEERLEVFNWKRTSDALWKAVLKTVADGS